MYTPKAQDIYRHFKGKVYQIVTLAEHTETGESLVIYQAMYDDFKIYARPLSMFLEKVDKQKYPNATQEYRFEKVEKLIAKQENEQVQSKANVLQQESTVPEPEIKQGNDTHEPESENLELDPLLLDFLDADTYTQKLDILAALHHRITDSMITTMAIASDIEVEDGDLESRYSELKNCLRTLERYEIERVR